MQPIVEIAKKLDLSADDLVSYGQDKAKVKLGPISREHRGHLVLVTAMSPSPAGEGKTTTAIGLVDGLCRLGKRAVACLREPSMGPVFGMKGGGAGGGRAQLYPAEDINLHFTGDFHAISSAHNLLTAAVENHIHYGNKLGIDPRTICWQRVLDVNDRALRQVVVGLGGRTGGVPRETRFDITAASEITAILALARDPDDLRRRLSEIVVGRTYQGEWVRAQDLKAVGSLMVLLRHAMLPNLVQTREGNPALLHSGPFANIAHGTNSVLATWAGLGGADYVVQEAGFGADLGAEKFLNIFCRAAEVKPRLAVLVCTLRAIRFHAGVPVADLDRSNPKAVRKGLVNPICHLRNLERAGLPVVVVINTRPEDQEVDRRAALDGLEEIGCKAVCHSAYQDGGEGALALAERVLETLARHHEVPLTPLYRVEDSLTDKIQKIAVGVYGASGVTYSRAARASLQNYEDSGFGRSLICMAKTQYSFSDDPNLVGRPKNFEIEIREARLAAGAGFVVPVSGEMMTMPGLAEEPNLERIDLDAEGRPILY